MNAETNTKIALAMYNIAITWGLTDKKLDPVSTKQLAKSLGAGLETLVGTGDMRAFCTHIGNEDLVIAYEINGVGQITFRSDVEQNQIELGVQAAKEGGVPFVLFSIALDLYRNCDICSTQQFNKYLDPQIRILMKPVAMVLAANLDMARIICNSDPSDETIHIIQEEITLASLSYCIEMMKQIKELANTRKDASAPAPTAP